MGNKPLARRSSYCCLARRRRAREADPFLTSVPAVYEPNGTRATIERIHKRRRPAWSQNKVQSIGGGCNYSK